MSIYPGKGGLTCLLSNLVKKVGVRGCISWKSDLPKFWMAITGASSHHFSSVSFVN